MQELVTFVAKSLVDHPDQVVVHETEGPEAIILELNVAPEDMGKVIGKQGSRPPPPRTASPFLWKFSNSPWEEPASGFRAAAFLCPF